MQKALLISIVAATLIIPMWAARGRGSARLGLRKTMTYMMVFNIVYLLAVMFIFPRL
jgi:hypothetical protein